MTGLVRIDRCVEPLFDNYSKLVENSPWLVWIDYSKLFSKFRILPSNFFERFSQAYSIEISEVTNYTHLFEFLKCYPSVQQLRIHFSKVKADRILELVHLLQPSLTELTIVEERPSNVLEIDLSFMCLLNLSHLCFESTHLPIEFVRKVATKAATKRGAHFSSFTFVETALTYHRIIICFASSNSVLIDFSCGRTFEFSSAEELILFLQGNRHLSIFLFV